MTLLRVLVLLAASATPVLADGFTPQPILACLNAGGTRGCVGLGAELCARDASQATRGHCLAGEGEWWTKQLTPAFARHLGLFEQRHGSGPAGAAAVRTLRQEEVAWHAYKAARCDHVGASFLGGSGTGNAHAGCDLEMTAERTLHHWDAINRMAR
ncbi:DUF1311 domain-containing protein [Jannaschia sp. Os4]|uniref:lysozyme inhibitor LprI family protein n=1 Tax=Jannaschia sp. Os4 TaxID=2807617 RepID=UPI0019396BC6|nr:lysozyme inhibitor LprI family protein [Jannaschia sp. Os4]MBM2576122.1 DUF1311 domain-containing protein [Jannaschia sp. Os4]